jgi:hypothetical protein
MIGLWHQPTTTSETSKRCSRQPRPKNSAQDLNGARLRDQLEMLRKAIGVTPKDFETRFAKDPKGTFEYMKARYERLALRGNHLA